MAFQSLWLEDAEAPYSYALGVGVGHPTFEVSLNATLGSLALAGNLQVLLPGSLSLTATLGSLGLQAFLEQSVLYYVAVRDLVNAGLNVIIQRVRSNVIPYDYVISWDPPVGSSVPAYTEVTLVVSDGPVIPTPNTSAIPNVTGLTTSEAVQTIFNAGFSLDQYTWSIDNSDAGTVIAQSPASGTLALPGTVIALTVSLGPTPPANMVTVPQ